MNNNKSCYDATKKKRKEGRAEERERLHSVSRNQDTSPKISVL